MIPAVTALLGCGHPEGHPSSPATSETSPPPTPGCPEPGLCSAAIASATWSDGPAGGWAAYDLAVARMDGQSVVLVGIPSESGASYEPSEVAVLRAADLGWIGTYVDDNDRDEITGFGMAVAADPAGDRFAVGAPDGPYPPRYGSAKEFGRLPDEVEPADTCALNVYGTTYGSDGGLHPGDDVAYLVTDNGEDLVVGDPSSTSSLAGLVARIDPELEGEHDVSEAQSTITGSSGFGWRVEAWDSDGDGVDELLVASNLAVDHFADWTGDLTEGDADVVWSGPNSRDSSFGEELVPLGDLDEDGLPELALGDPTAWGTQQRTGALSLVPGGPQASSAAADLPYQFVGTELGEGVGSGATAGDYDGDGQLDLVVGAYGVLPGYHPGKVLGYLGPLTPGTRTAADADFVVVGEHVGDWFGSDVVAVDADGDGRADLVVGAQGANGWSGEVYLLTGAALLP